jgi:glutaredoxin 3
MPKIEMYTTPFCPFCVRAKALLKRKGAEFEEIDVTMVPGARDEMLQRSGGRRTVPQIFINGDGIGGSDELHALDSKGELDRLLGA